MRMFLILAAVLAFAGCADTSEIDNAPKATVHEAVKAKPSEPVAAVKAEPDAAGKVKAKEAVSFVLDPSQSEIGFLGAKITGTHDGGFRAFKGAMEWTADAPTGLTVNVEMGSLFADKPKLEGHLKSPDFFDVANKPLASFASKSFAQLPGKTDWTVTGALTINETTREISFPANVLATDEGIRAGAKFQINRQDFGITYPGKPDDLIKDEVRLRVDLFFPRG